MNYPVTRKVNQIDDYHGTPVPDPYRWLEDVDAPETLDWIQAQNALTFEYLEKIPDRQRLVERLTELWNYPKATAPFRRGNRFFQFRNTGLQNQDVLYTMDTPDGEGFVLLDPNTLSTDGTVALNNWSVSKDGNLLAYASSQSGSDWVTWRVRSVESGQDLPDLLEWSKFSNATWLQDGSGFYYGRYAAPEEGQEYEAANYNQRVFFHKINTPQAEDTLVYERPDFPTWGFYPVLSDDGRYLVLQVSEGTDSRNRLFYQDLHSRDPFVELIPDLEAAYEFLGNDGPLFYLLTDLDTPRKRVIGVDIHHPERSSWKTLVAETEDNIEFALLAGNELVCITLHDARHRLLRYSLQGHLLGEISLPAPGAIQAYAYQMSLHGEREDPFVYYAFHSFVYPPTIFQFDLRSGETRQLFKPDIQFDFDQYITEQVFVTSKDGTRLPVFLTYRHDLQKNGQNPTLLYGYGGFNIPLTPLFTLHRLAWLEMGGIFAQAVLRGGSEYGEAWHQAGMKHTKQNVFDDFIACAEFLIQEGYTSTPKLAIEGRSNGGLLVGACLVQRPDLFGAALPAVGVMDMLRFHKFTIGWAWVSDYGSPDNPEDFKALYAYSPLHNLKPGVAYPATLVTTGDHDDRVVPGHSFKFAAALQAAQSGTAPTLIRIQTKAGHGFGKPTAVLIQEQADIYTFLVGALGI